uniref:Thyroglobulin type-1 domain-containing protein n=1 Tax=Meleagris gallopavo TaxID=9103 RepID=A0A803XU34_MELGA
SGPCQGFFMALLGTSEPRDLFVPTCTKEGRYEEVQCYAGECWCLDTSGKEVPGSRVQGEHPSTQNHRMA